MKYLRFRFWLILLATLWLVSCSSITSIPGIPTPRPIPTVTSTPTRPILVVRGISCKQGVQLILQKQVSSVIVSYLPGTPSELTVDEIDLNIKNGYPTPINDMYECDTKLKAAIAKVNPTLPKDQQITITYKTETGY